MKTPGKSHGGDNYTATKIVKLFPPHTKYHEGCAGSLAVLFARQPPYGDEVVNDLNGDISNFWSVLQQPALFELFHRTVEAIPFSELEWRQHHAARTTKRAAAGSSWALALSGHTQVDQALSFFVDCRQSMSARMEDFARDTSRQRRGMNEQVSAWLSSVERLPEAHARLRRVLIFNCDVVESIDRTDGPGVLHYLDPTFYPDTRTAPKIYEHEMTAAQHEKLLKRILACEGKVIIAGYRCPLYDDLLQNWRRIEFVQPNHSAKAKTKAQRIEAHWLNYDPS